MAAPYLIREGRSGEIDALLALEQRAAQLLLQHGAYDLFAMHRLGPEDLQAGIADGILRVAECEGAPVGFALAGMLDGHAHLFEMDVVPEHGRRGIGSALLEAVCVAARTRGFTALSLVTLRDVPWNAPFYARRGFVEWLPPRWGLQLQQIMDKERLLGFPMQLRVVMGRSL